MTAPAIGLAPGRRDALARRVRRLVAATISYNVPEWRLAGLPVTSGSPT